MKKLILCLILLLSGCNNEYTLIRNEIGDEIKFGLIIDENEKDLITGLTINHTDVYVCKENCLKQIMELEKEYVDGLVLIGEQALNAINQFDNENQIPIIQVIKQSQFDALKHIFPEYQNWLYVNDGTVIDETLEVDAYYFEEGIKVEVEQPFYQANHNNSMCTLVLDKEQFEIDLNQRIQYLINANPYNPPLIIKWIKK